LLAFQKVGFRLSDQDIRPIDRLLIAHDENLRRLPNVLRSLLYFAGQRHTAEEMGADGLGQIATAARAQIGPAPQRIGRELSERKAKGTGWAVRDEMCRAIHEHQRTLFRGQRLGPFAVDVRQPTVVRLDNVRRGDRPRAPVTLYLHEPDLAIRTIPDSPDVCERTPPAHSAARSGAA
jgi:hypothetical protein